MFFVYVLRSTIDQKLYIGYTRDIKKRLNDHNSGRVSSTKARKPLELIFKEAYGIKQEAQKRERFLKSGAGHEYIRKKLLRSLKSEDSRGGAAR